MYTVHREGLVCKRVVVLVLTSDCEQGNKTAFINLQAEIESNEVDPCLSLLSILLDYPHVGKCLNGQIWVSWEHCEMALMPRQKRCSEG